MKEAVLLGDIGGTTARFALFADRKLGSINHFAVADHASATDAIAGFLAQSRRDTKVTAAIMGIACPAEGERCPITNSHWVIDTRELRATFGFETVTLMNDFEAIAWSLPHLAAKDLNPIAGGEAVRKAPMVVIGPGTGLGMAALVPRADGAVAIATEGGHATLASFTSREDAIIEQLRRRFGHVSAERALSGGGLENLYAAIAMLDGASVAARTAAEITRHALDGTCAASRAALDMFCAMLGTVAGNLALTFRTRGGVFIAGGIVPRLGNYLAQSEFRARFESKGRFSRYLAAIPTSVIMHPDAAFLGLQALAMRASAPSSRTRSDRRRRAPAAASRHD